MSIIERVIPLNTRLYYQLASITSNACLRCFFTSTHNCSILSAFLLGMPVMIVKRRYIISIFLFTSLSLSWLSYFYVRDWELTNTQQYSSSQLLNTISAVRSALNKFHALPYIVSQQLDVQALLDDNNLKNLYRVRRYLEQTNLIVGSASLLVLDSKGDVAAYSNWRAQPNSLNNSYNQSAFFQQAIKGEQGSGVWFDEHRVAWFYFSAPIYHLQRLTGVAVIRIDIAKTLEELTTREAFYLSDRQNALIYATKTLGISPSDQLISHTFNAFDTSITETLLDGTTINVLRKNTTDYLVQQVLLDDTQWNIGVLIPLNVKSKHFWGSAAVFSSTLILALVLMYLREWRAKKLSQQQVIAAQLESEARARHIINTAQSGLITLDKHAHITFINPLVMQQFGISLSNVANQSIGILFDNLSSFVSLDRVLENLKQGNFSPLTGYEVVAKRSDGSVFPVMFSIKLMRSTPVIEYLVTLVDITKRKQLERSLKEANESLEYKVIRRTRALESAQAELLKVEKMAVLGRMSTAIVHEINQPLTALRNYLAILARVKDNPDLIDQQLDSLNHLVDNMVVITRQLKTFSYAKPNRGQAVDLISITRDVLLLLAPEFAQQQIHCEYSTQSDSAIVLADRTGLEQVLFNLLRNSMDAMAQAHTKEIKLQYSIVEHTIVCQLSDTGGGINEQQLNQIFEPFFTTKEIGMGLGLGLSIIKNILDDFQGDISAKNTSTGLVFTFSLPLLDKTVR